MATTTNEARSLSEDLKDIDVPFDLFTGLSLVTEELESKGYTYTNFFKKSNAVLTFTSEDEMNEVYVTIEKENLLIRQFTYEEDTKKLKVIYVLKPSERTFKLI